MKIRNNTAERISFVVRGPAVDGVPPTDSVGPGETKDIDADPRSAHVRGFALSGAITVIELVPNVAPAPVAALQAVLAAQPAQPPAFVPLAQPAPQPAPPPNFVPLNPTV